MADNIQQYVETCACGHDKASHFEGKHACLCRGCDDCKKYITPEDKAKYKALAAAMSKALTVPQFRWYL